MSGGSHGTPDPHGETVVPGTDAFAETMAPAGDAFAATVAPAGPVPPVTPKHAAAPTAAPVDPRASSELATELAREPIAVSGTGLSPGVIVADRYQVVRALGSGGTGEVWEVIHVEIKRALALKAVSVNAESEIGRRLLREAKIVAQLQHPGIVDITDFGETPSGKPFLAMELVRGPTVREVLRTEGRLEWTRARDLAVQVADALAHAHDAGVVHRDLKPANIFFVPGGRGREVAKVIDFGIAKATELAGEEATLTRTGVAFGTPAFMSPEQVRGEKADARSDIYALGCVLYEVLTGTRPFVADTAGELMYRQLFEHPAAPSQVVPDAAIPTALDQLVARCLRKDPSLRFQTMAELRDLASTLGSTATVIAVPEETIAPPASALLARYGPPRGGTALPSATQIPDVRRGATKPVHPKTSKRRGTPAWVLLACGFGIPLLIAGIGFGVWRALQDPKAEHYETPDEPAPTLGVTPAAPAQPAAAHPAPTLTPDPPPSADPEPAPTSEPAAAPKRAPRPKASKSTKAPAPPAPPSRPKKAGSKKLDPPPRPNKDGLIDAFGD